MYGLSDNKYEEMENIECLLNLNMALCKLKLHEWTAAIESVRMAIQIDNENPKAYYRMAEAYIGMGEYEKAKQENKKSKEKNDRKYGGKKDNLKDETEYKKNEKAINLQFSRIDNLHKKQIAKQKKDDREMAKYLQSKLKKSHLSKDMDKLKKKNKKMTDNSHSEESGFEIDDDTARVTEEE